jgi:hypothetical protein
MFTKPTIGEGDNNVNFHVEPKYYYLIKVPTKREVNDFKLVY